MSAPQQKPPDPGTRRAPPQILRPVCVQVPLDLPAMSDSAMALWIVLVWRAGKDDWCRPGQKRIQVDLGRGGSDPRHAAELAGELVAAGLLEVVRKYVQGKTRNLYRPLQRVRPHDGRAYVELSPALLVAMAAGEATPGDLRAAVRWLAHCRDRGGWTSDGPTDMAAEWGQGVRTVRRHRSTLVRLGVLEERQRKGKAPLTAPPGKLPEERDEQTPALVRPRPQIPGYPGHRSPVTPATDPRQNYPQENYPKLNYPSSVPVGADVTAVPREAESSAAPPRASLKISSKPTTKRRPSRASPAALEVLAQLPPAWRDGPPWVRRQVAARLERATSTAIVDPVTGTTTVPSPAAVVAVLTDYGSPAHLGAIKHLPALDRLPALLERAVMFGNVCPDCGHLRDRGADGWHRCAGHPRQWQQDPHAGHRGVWIDAPSRDPATPEWATSLPGVCISCDQPGAARPELPYGSTVCDACWTASLDAQLAA